MRCICPVFRPHKPKNVGFFYTSTERIHEPGPENIVSYCFFMLFFSGLNFACANAKARINH